MANFQSMIKSPLVSDMLTMHVMVGRQEVIISFNISVLIWSSSQLLFFIPIISLFTSSFMSGLKLVLVLVYLFLPYGIVGCL